MRHGKPSTGRNPSPTGCSNFSKRSSSRKSLTAPSSGSGGLRQTGSSADPRHKNNSGKVFEFVKWMRFLFPPNFCPNTPFVILNLPTQDDSLIDFYFLFSYRRHEKAHFLQRVGNGEIVSSEIRVEPCFRLCPQVYQNSNVIRTSYFVISQAKHEIESTILYNSIDKTDSNW